MPRTSQNRVSDVGVADLVTVLLHKVLFDASAELARAEGATGRIIVSLEVHLVNGKPRWHSGSAHFSEHHQYQKET